MTGFQLQRETPSSTMGFGFFEAGVGSLFVEYFQFCSPLESSVRIAMAQNAWPGKFSPVAGYARRGGLPRAQTDETERPTRRYMQVELYG